MLLNRGLVAVLRWLVALAMPVFIVLLWLSLLWRPWFVRWEYGKGDFPPDTYGFTSEQRLDFTLRWLDYYHSSQPPEVGIQALQALRMPGTERPLHDAAELSHMVDVRRLTDTLLRRVLPLSGIILLGGLAALFIPRRTRRDGRAAVFVGGVITSGLLIVFIGFVLLSWRTFFVTLHNVFFPPGTWTFDYSSTLIRLFPDRFWFDAGILLVGGALIAGLLVLLVGYLLGLRDHVRP